MTELPPTPPVPPTPPPGPPPAAQAPQFTTPAAPSKSSKATTSLVFGVIGLIFCPIVCSTVALILGYQARSEIEQSNGMMSGAGQAMAGIVLGWLSLVLGALVFIVFLAL